MTIKKNISPTPPTLSPTDLLIHGFIEELKQFEYQIQFQDCIWDVIFPSLLKKNKAKNKTENKDKKPTPKWHHVKVYKDHYMTAYWVSLVDAKRDFLRDRELPTLEVRSNEPIKIAPSLGSASSWESRHSHQEPAIPQAWIDLIESAMDWLKLVKKDWIKANKTVLECYPVNRRSGTVPNSLVRASLKDVYRLDQELGEAKTKKFIEIVESNYFREKEKTERKSMTANDFFEYCKIAYPASKREDESIDENLTGRAMYERYADNRHEGLLDIKGNSAKEFADWIDGTHPKKSSGGHPWEVKRGGNTTHINMSVSRPDYYQKEGFVVCVSAGAIHRMKETICMFLALYDAGLPITIGDPEGIRLRLLAQDNIGLVPEQDSLHRANQSFRKDQRVYDVLHFDELGRYKTRVKPFVTWEALPILKPKGVY